jgi:hypothetical protein
MGSPAEWDGEKVERPGPASQARIAARLAAVVFVSIVLSACSLFGPTLVDHAFAFDITECSDAEILDYRYGNSKQPGARTTESERQSGQIRQTLIHGRMLRGDDLYVKWRDTRTGEVHEETVDLASRLPWNITDHEIRFVIAGPTLSVYLLSWEKRPPDWPVYLYRYRYRKAYQIYPDLPKKAR